MTLPQKRWVVSKATAQRQTFKEKLRWPQAKMTIDTFNANKRRVYIPQKK